MDITPVTDQKEWDRLITTCANHSFLQSWNWGRFVEAHGGKPFYWQIIDGKKGIGAALTTLMISRRARYAECVSGPLRIREGELDWATYKPLFDHWLGAVDALAKEHKLHFLRLRLPFEHTAELQHTLQAYGFRETLLYYQAELTRRIRIDREPEAIFAEMKKKTRYEIRRSERDGVRVTRFDHQKREGWETAFNHFLTLYHQMVDRQQYVPYSDSYLREQFELFLQSGQSSLYIAEFEDTPVAGAIFFHYGNTTTYHHAASLPVTKISPPAFILWQAIQDSISRGDQWFDLFGIAPPGKRYASRTGLSAFKEGFGGEVHQWLRTHDLVYQPVRYKISQAVEYIPAGFRSIGSRLLPKL